ncbi:hypothetical protein D3C80_1779020 [compost metagenome]
MTVGYQLACTGTGISKSQTVNEVVQTAFKQDHEVFTGNTCHFLSSVKQSTELFFTQAVHMAQFLFFLKLHTIVADFSPLSWTMLSRRERAFQIFSSSAQGNAETAAEFKFRTSVTCHCIGRLLYKYNFVG